MKNTTFVPAELLIPAALTNTWPVIACDQFSSDKGYWKDLEKQIGDDPSTLKLILPEAYLDEVDVEAEAAKRSAEMKRYLAEGLFRTYEKSFLYVERTVTGGAVRHGLVGAIDLEQYEYTRGNTAPIRATEKTVQDRLPPRVKVRREAAVELPHVMVLIDDEERKLIEPLTEKKNSFPKVYDLSLLGGGGQITGWVIGGKDAEAVSAVWDTFLGRDIQMVIGDGNHSLAAAKAWWDEVKVTLSDEERKSHPARFALVEVNNVYDEGVAFEPIHRVVFHTEPDVLLADMERAIGDKTGRPLRIVTAKGERELLIEAGSLGGFIDTVQTFFDTYLASHPGQIDYIHDDSSALSFGRQENAAAFLMPPMEKGDLFKTVRTEGVFPKKSFSIGHARDKRYYLESRKIVL